MDLASRCERDVLYVDIASPDAPGTIVRLLNVHLEPRGDAGFSLLRETGCSGGVMAGEFNAVLAEDHALVEKYKLVDAWVALHGPHGGHTWGAGAEPANGLGPGRLDKVVMLGLQPEEIEVLWPDPCQPWRDHYGLRCTFTI
ncbi:hypothetical protein EYR38_008335 [Pleurotus pulmonarius]|nr:hypothetical protein EYR38_008335 [Pleurotus pulmonarius]